MRMNEQKKPSHKPSYTVRTAVNLADSKLLTSTVVSHACVRALAVPPGPALPCLFVCWTLSAIISMSEGVL